MENPTIDAQLHSIQTEQSKGDLAMSKILTLSTATIMLGLVAMGSARPRAANHRDYRPWAHTQSAHSSRLRVARIVGVDRAGTRRPGPGLRCAFQHLLK
jgi:hypothetical protein